MGNLVVAERPVHEDGGSLVSVLTYYYTTRFEYKKSISETPWDELPTDVQEQEEEQLADTIGELSKMSEFSHQKLIRSIFDDYIIQLNITRNEGVAADIRTSDNYIMSVLRKR